MGQGDMYGFEGQNVALKFFDWKRLPSAKKWGEAGWGGVRKKTEVQDKANEFHKFSNI